MTAGPEVATAVVRSGVLGAEGRPALRVPWWSVAKTAIAAAVLVLVRDGRLDLDETVPGSEASVREVLGHRGGLADYGALADYHAAVEERRPPWSLDEVRRRLSGVAAPRRGEFSYSNLGYRLLSELVADRDGGSAAAAIDRLVLEPLGIRDVAFPSDPAELQAASDVDLAGYHPGYVLHGLMVGPLGSAAALVDGILGEGLLPGGLRATMIAGDPVGGPIPGRPFHRPGYGLGVMTDGPDGPAGHTGGGPGSVIAAYRRLDAGGTVTVAAFAEGDDVGLVERVAFSAGA